MTTPEQLQYACDLVNRNIRLDTNQLCKVGKLCKGRCIPKNHKCRSREADQPKANQRSRNGLKSLIGVAALATGIGVLTLYQKQRQKQVKEAISESKKFPKTATFNANNDPAGFDNTLLNRNIRAHENSIRFNDYESAAVFDDLGNIITSARGNANSVNLRFENREDVAKVTGKTFTHNHPADPDDPDGRTFSPQDWMAGSIFEFKEIRAVTPTQLFILRPPKEGWNGDWWEDKGYPVLERQRLMHYAELSRHKQGEETTYDTRLSAKQLGSELWHRVTRDTAKELGMEYIREQLPKNPK